MNHVDEATEAQVKMDPEALSKETISKETPEAEDRTLVFFKAVVNSGSSVSIAVDDNGEILLRFELDGKETSVSCDLEMFGDLEFLLNEAMASILDTGDEDED